MRVKIDPNIKIIHEIQTNSRINIYVQGIKLCDNYTNDTQNYNINFKQLICLAVNKFKNECPKQIYLHPDELKKCRCSQEEYMLLIIQNITKNMTYSLTPESEQCQGLINNGDCEYEFVDKKDNQFINIL